MSKLNNRYWLETDDFFDSTGKNTEKIKKGILPTAFSHSKSSLGTNTPILWKPENFPKKITCCKKPTQMHTTQYPDLFVTYREGFNMNNGFKNPIVVDEDPSFYSKFNVFTIVLWFFKKYIVFVHWMTPTVSVL